MTSANLLPPDDEPRWHGRCAVIAIVVLALVAMGRLCTDEFTLWDDLGTIYQNPWLLPPTWRTVVHFWMMPAYGIYIPVTYMVWAAIAIFAKVPPDQYGITLNPWMFHGASVAFHLLAILVAFRILRLLNADVFASAAGALLFGVHPVQVEAVGWASGLKDVLSGFLALVALWQYTAFSLSDLKGRASGLRYLLATTAFMLAMFAKPSAMALPVAALAIDRWGIGRSWKRLLPGIAGWIVIAIPIAIVARVAQFAENTPMPALWLRPLIVLDSLAFYLWKVVCPINLIVDYGRSPTAVFQRGWCYWDWIFPVGVAAFLIKGALRRPVLLAAGAIFVAGCLPVLGFTPALFQFFSTTTDHYLYLSMFGPGLALAWLLSVYPSTALRVTTCFVIFVLIALTNHQAAYWQNDRLLFLHDVDVNPASYVGYINLGGVYQRDHDLPRCIAAFENATRANPEYSVAYGDLADALSEAGRFDEAIDQAKRAVDLQIKYPNLRPSWPQDNELLGQLLFDKGRFTQAIPYMQSASDLEPENQHLRNELVKARKQIEAATRPATQVSTSKP